MKKLLIRTLSGIVFVSVLLFSILMSKESFIALFYVIMLICLYEFKKMIQLKSIFPYLVGSLVYIFGYLLHYTSSETMMTKIIGSFLFLTVAVLFISILILNKKNIISHLGKIFLSIIYIAIPFTLIAKIPFMNSQFSYMNTTILGIFILVWVNDSFAFLVGKNIGKHKLLERISPNKTIEGFFGGMLFTFLAGYILAEQFNALSLAQWIVIAGIVSVFGVIGDLIESMFKRQAGIKDSSNFIPGHGGFLDRFDSVLFAAPFIFIYLQIFQ